MAVTTYLLFFHMLINYQRHFWVKMSLMSRNACNGENGETGEKSPAAGDLNWMPKVTPWRLAILEKMAILAKLAILAKIARGRAICGKIFKLDAKSGPFKVDN